MIAREIDISNEEINYAISHTFFLLSEHTLKSKWACVFFSVRSFSHADSFEGKECE